MGRGFISFLFGLSLFAFFAYPHESVAGFENMTCSSLNPAEGGAAVTSDSLSVAGQPGDRISISGGRFIEVANATDPVSQQLGQITEYTITTADTYYFLCSFGREL